MPELGAELTELEREAAWNEAAARASERALAKLRALPLPGSNARVSQILSVMEQQRNVPYQAAAASVGDLMRVRMLFQLRIRLTHRKDGLVYRLAMLWGVSPDALQGVSREPAGRERVQPDCLGCDGSASKTPVW